MGTRGFRIIKFRGRYWVFYNHWDSYPEGGMGESLVKAIPTDPVEYKKWLQTQREFYAKWDDLLHRLLCIEPNDLSACSSTVNTWNEVFDSRLDITPPNYESGFNDMSIEWTYTIDLDSEVFTVDGGAHFRLDRISQSDAWIPSLDLDSGHERLALPYDVPDGLLTGLDLDIDTYEPGILDYWKKLRTNLVTPNRVQYTLTCPAFQMRWIMFNYFQTRLRQSLSISLLGWRAMDMPFREIAYFILCLAAGGDHCALMDERRISNLRKKGASAAVVRGNDSEGEKELISLVGAGFHLQDLLEGSAPTGTKYWLQGALVSLVPRLDRSGIFEKAIADVVHYGFIKRGFPTFNAVLVSIEHLVLVRRLSSGNIDHTNILPLIHIGTHLSKDARNRYGDEVVDEWCRARARRANSSKRKVSEEIESDDQSSNYASSGESGSQKDGEVIRGEPEIPEASAEVSMAKEGGEGGDDIDGASASTSKDDNTKDDKKLQEWTVEDTFLSLVNFFESTTNEAMRPMGGSRDGVFPAEIYTAILHQISDVETYNSCLKVSQQFRILCLQRPLIMDDVAISKAPLGVSTSQAQGEEAPQLSRFCAVELSSDRYMDISFQGQRPYASSSRGPPNYTICRIVVGSEPNRRSFCHGSLTLQGLQLTAPLKTKEWKLGENSHNDYESPSGLGDSWWAELFTTGSITSDSSLGKLEEFWSRAVKHFPRKCDFKIAANSVTGCDWINPPNTAFHMGSCDNFDNRTLCHYLMLRIKRPNKYWDSLWEDIIRGAVGDLAAPDNSDTLQFYKYPKDYTLGADNPFVMLAIGFDVRLFKWERGVHEQSEGDTEQTSAVNQLVEFEPCRMYNPWNADDRDVIEKFLEDVAIRAAEIDRIKNPVGQKKVESDTEE